MSTVERRRTTFMFATIALLHVAGFAVFILFVVPGHYKGLGIGIAVLAYSLGLRHAFDADHISAIDNTIRKLMNDGRHPLSVGFWFSLGHSTIVVGIGVGIVVAEKAVYGAVSNNNSALEQFGGILGTIASASFLFLIALLNLVILVGIIKVFRAMRHGSCNETELERQLQNRGFMNRFFGHWMNTIDKEWKMYPLGVVFGLGFDTATEVTLLSTTALLASQSLPFYAILCLPILFTAGMTLLDTLDGIFMNFAYSWAFFNPVRKVYYNLAITGLSVAICFFIGGIEVLGLAGKEWGALHGSFWDFMATFDLNKAGFVIVGIFVLCWAAALAFWKVGRVEEKWSARLKVQPAPAAPADGDAPR
ncbi:HoxN/HupN/NixA family nickel/cobalt transporter [Arthrobacter sp. H35-D1]|uniref:HoxN/HupN/NixA family nickel/cobalt transporter n=1 Tax=Arthrobacter sp. H35-D1 TaxID=3046202 RepID=UPI0024B9FFCC|nr:HoxN/HupN/NixA family nickel/cobalt transporter [Arthrobacter sp. H35-D1]MDJ0312449.1 HoxN/HupN/NixA family nickel/cobalt transporter [Arthrobacter sp. H35-D1]